MSKTPQPLGVCDAERARLAALTPAEREAERRELERRIMERRRRRGAYA